MNDTKKYFALLISRHVSVAGATNHNAAWNQKDTVSVNKCHMSYKSFGKKYLPICKITLFQKSQKKK